MEGLSTVRLLWSRCFVINTNVSLRLVIVNPKLCWYINVDGTCLYGYLKIEYLTESGLEVG